MPGAGKKLKRLPAFIITLPSPAGRYLVFRVIIKGIGNAPGFLSSRVNFRRNEQSVILVLLQGSNVAAKPPGDMSFKDSFSATIFTASNQEGVACTTDSGKR